VKWNKWAKRKLPSALQSVFMVFILPALQKNCQLQFALQNAVFALHGFHAGCTKAISIFIANECRFRFI